MNYNLTPEEKIKIQEVYKYALTWVAGDVRKAAHLLPDYVTFYSQDEVKNLYPTYDGGAMVGSVLLAFNAIQYVSMFFSPFSKDGIAFEKFVDAYFCDYDGIEIYSLRNALFKQYTTKFFIKGAKGKSIKYAICILRPKDHLQISGEYKYINVETLAKDVYDNINLFFEEVLNNKHSQQVVAKICNHYDNFLLKSL